MKCADIPDDLFIEVVKWTVPSRVNSPWPGILGYPATDFASWEPGTPLPDGTEPWRRRGDVKTNLEYVMQVEIPENLFLAKARKLGFKGKLEGCTDCSCRGDYHLPEECTGC